MRPLIARAVLSALIGLGASASLAAQDPDQFIGATSELFTNLYLIDGRGGPPQDNAAILVWNGRIRGVGPRSSLQVPQGTQVVNLEGAFVIPGLIDAHAAPRDSATLAGMLALGITGVREAAMPRDRFEARGRDQLAGGPLPNVFIGGPMLVGPGGHGGLSIGSEDEIERAVDRLVDDGARFISVAPSVPPPWIRDIARTAREHDAGVWMEGRADGWLLTARYGADVVSGVVSLDPDMLPEDVRPVFASALAERPSAALGTWLDLVDPAGAQMDLAISALLSSDAAVVPLLAATEAPLRCVSDGTGCGGRTDAERAGVLDHWPAALEIVRQLHEQDIRLLVGSGVPSGEESGARFHREMQLLVEAGVPPIDVLSMATRNGAIALGELHRRGTIEAGKQADFIILGSDPTADIRNAADVRVVVLRGRGWVAGPDGFERIRFR